MSRTTRAAALTLSEVLAALKALTEATVKNTDAMKIAAAAMTAAITKGKP